MTFAQIKNNGDGHGVDGADIDIVVEANLFHPAGDGLGGGGVGLLLLWSRRV